jgi:hypothetical protein
VTGAAAREERYIFLRWSGAVDYFVRSIEREMGICVSEGGEGGVEEECWVCEEMFC